MNSLFKPSVFVLALLLIEEAHAQVLVPPFVPAVPVLVPNGIGFRYRSGNLAVGGFLNTGTSVGYVVPAYPLAPIPGRPTVLVPPVYSVLPTYGVTNNRISVQIIQPTVVLSAPSAGPDYSGVDLDVTRPPWAPDRPEPQRVPEKKFEPKPVPPPPVEIKKPAAPNEAQLLQAGVRAFRDKELGLAAQRFRQASLAFPESSRPYFLLGQTLLALGKYGEAYDQIALGLKAKPDWPSEKFNPRLELYGIEVDLYQQHIQALEESARANNGKALFLLGYIRWFEQKRPEALDCFRKAKPLLADPGPVNRFLDAAPLVVRR